MLDFNVGKSGLMLRAEVDELFAAVDHSVIPHLFESRVNTGDDVFVESKSKVGPSAARAKSTDLEFHIAALLFDEIPDAGVEFVAAKFEAGVAFFFEGTFIDNPSFETGVVGTRNIPSRLAAKAIVAG